MLSHHCWIFLTIAIFFGVFGTVCMKISSSLKKWKPVVSLCFFYLVSFIALTFAIQGIEIGIVYAIWSGIGTILIAIIGYMLFDEGMTKIKILSIMLIVMGVLGMNLADVFH